MAKQKQKKQKTEPRTLVRGLEQEKDHDMIENIDEPVDETNDEPVDETEATAEPKRVKKVEYVFPKVPECPRCRTHDNEAYKTDGKIQYRRCRRGHCRHRWHVIGVKKK